MVGYTFVKISIFMTNFQCFSPSGRFSLSKQLEAHPRQTVGNVLALSIILFSF